MREEWTIASDNHSVCACTRVRMCARMYMRVSACGCSCACVRSCVCSSYAGSGSLLRVLWIFALITKYANYYVCANYYIHTHYYLRACSVLAIFYIRGNYYITTFALFFLRDNSHLCICTCVRVCLFACACTSVCQCGGGCVRLCTSNAGSSPSLRV